MAKTIFEKYSEINGVQHQRIIKNPYPNANEFKKSAIKNIIFHTMQLKQILERTQAFETVINNSIDPIFDPFKKYPDLTAHTQKLINDICFLEEWLRQNGVKYTPTSLNVSAGYAIYILSCNSVQVLAHFFANTHAVIIAHKESIENIIPQSKIEKKGLSHYHFEGIKAKEFEALLNEVPFNGQEESFLQEVNISFDKLFEVLQEQDHWCAQNQDKFQSRQKAFHPCCSFWKVATVATTIAASAAIAYTIGSMP